MPDYKRKKFKKSSKHNKIKTNSTKASKKNIGVVPENGIKVIRGSKFKRKEKFKIALGAISLIFIFCLVLSLVLPVSLYENTVNFVSGLGFGSYPLSLSGGVTYNSVSNGSHYFVLTDTNIAAYSNGGKIIFDELHGFSNPILVASSTRALVYDQGGKTAYIYNLSGKINTVDTDNEIITASISRNGDFAIATRSDKYTSVATVYNSKFKKVFTWNSAKDIINNVLVNSTGKKLAVTTLNAVSGQYETKLLIFNFKSADPIYSLDLQGSLPLSLINTGKGISIISVDKYKFLHWSKFDTNEISISGEINLLRKSTNGVLLAYNRANDRSDNTILLISNQGKKISDFKINNTIIDIQYKNGRVYSASDSVVTIFDKNGKILRHGECVYGTQKISVISSHSVAAITDSEIFNTEIKQKGE